MKNRGTLVNIAGIIAIIFVVAGMCFSARKEYLSSSSEEKAKLKEELRNPVFVLAGSLLPIGFLLVFIAFVFQSAPIRYSGLILVGLGLIIEGAEMTKQTARGIYLVVIRASVTLVTGFFMTKSFW
jgi:glucose uptake protein GlcU